MDMFKFITQYIDLRKMSDDSAKTLVEHINYVFDNEKERETIKTSPDFLCVLKKQKPALTKELDMKIAKYLPVYYEWEYKLETTENAERDMPEFVR